MKKKFKTLLIDPPWPESGGGKIKRGADKHYPLVAVKDMKGVIVGSGVFTPAEDSHLYLWATNNYLGDAVRLIAELGFRYVTCITWAKDRFGPGQYFRGQTEQLLFAVRGEGLKLRRAWTEKKNLSTLIEARHQYDDADKRIHSAKPGEAYDLIEAASPPPRIELFARRRRAAWEHWGNEV
jgi:N6-adenosine-specific RNA methylase IME4